VRTSVLTVFSAAARGDDDDLTYFAVILTGMKIAARITVQESATPQGQSTMKNLPLSRIARYVAFVTVLLPSVVQAQVMIDMSRVTCTDYLAMPPDQSRMFSAWMSGYFNQKSGYAWIDLGAYARNIASIKQWCASYPSQLVMNGLQRATGKQ
jgi:hypothetical protein